MKKLIGLGLVLLVLLSGIAMAGSKEYLSAAREYYNAACGIGSEVHDSWCEGVKQQYRFDLKEIKVTIEMVDFKEDENNVGILANVTITAYCVDEKGFKKRVAISRVVIIMMDKPTKNVIRDHVIDTSGFKVLDGWNGKDT